MLSKLRGYNVPHLSWKTRQQERGLFNYPSNLRQIRDDPTSELDYEQFCAALEAEGINWLRVKLTGWQRNWSTELVSCGLEPPPAGSFNVWQSALDPADLARYRDEQITGAMSPALWRRSNLGQLIDAAERHGIKFNVIPFENNEWRGKGWELHAWNANNRYINGQPCQPQDRGFLEHARDVFTHPDAIAAAKARIDFILKTFEGRDVIGSWELCAEMTWMITKRQEIWGLDSWDQRMVANVREKMVPWVEEMASYIKARHPAPVGNGQVFTGNALEFHADPDHFRNVLNEVYNTPSLDFVMINWYLSGDLARCRGWLKMCQEHFEGKQIVVEQYAPWPPNRTVPYTEEIAPFYPSKAHEWIAACGEYGVVGPMRWPGIREERRNWWLTGGYADLGMMRIAGVSGTMAKYVDLADWKGRGKCFDENIRSPGLALKSSWGDGQHVTMFLSWNAPDAKTITVTGLVDQDYTFYLFDWVRGDLISSQDVTASGGQLVLSQVPTRDGRLAGYIARKAQEAKPKIKLVFRDMETNEEKTVELQANHAYLLETSTIQST